MNSNRTLLFSNVLNDTKITSNCLTFTRNKTLQLIAVYVYKENARILVKELIPPYAPSAE